MRDTISDTEIISPQELQKLDDAMGECTTGASEDDGVEVTLYDFRSAYRLSSTHVETITRDCDRIGSALNRTLSVYLSGTATTRFRSIDRMKARQYLTALPDSAVLASFTLLPDLPAGLIHLDRPLAFAAIEMMLGGCGEDSPVPGGSLSHIEVSLLKTLFEEIIGAAQTAAKVLTTLPDKVHEVYNSPVAVHTTEKDSWVLCASFQMQIGSRRGTATLQFPSVTLQRLLTPSGRRGANREQKADIAETVNESRVPVRAVLAEAQMSTRTVASLEEGQIISLQLPPEKAQTVQLKIAGETSVTARPGTKDGMVAVQIVGDRPDETVPRAKS